MDSWIRFVDWAKRFADDGYVEVEERVNKLISARRMATALQAARDSADEWPQLLGSAVSSSDGVEEALTRWLGKSIGIDPDATRNAFVDLYDAQSVEAIDAFAQSLGSLGSDASAGNVATLASLVLMSAKPEDFPTHRAQFVADWARLVDRQVGGEARERYQLLLDLCDGLLSRLPNDEPLSDRLDAQALAWATLSSEPSVRWSPLEQARFTAWREGKAADDLAVPRGSGWNPEMERAVWALLGSALRGENSVIAPNLRSWQSGVATELHRRIELNPDFGSGTFLGKLEGQLAGASDEVIVLAAELLYLHSAPLSNIKPATKIKRITSVLKWTGGGYRLPDSLAAGLSAGGSFNGGVGFNVGMWRQLNWLCRFVMQWQEVTPEQRVAALRDPFVFSAVAGETPREVSSMRYSLEYLAWPGVFPWVASPDHRAQIVKAMAGDFGGPTGTDAESRTRDLVSLRQWHQRSTNQEIVDWYAPPYGARWWKGATVAPRAWLVRPSGSGAELVQEWQDDGFVSLKAEMLGVVEPGVPEPTVRALVRVGYNHLDRAQQESLTADYYRFLTVMKQEDLVVTITQDQILLGVVGGSAEFVEASGSRLRRSVSWSEQRVDRSELPDPVPSLLEQQGLVVDLTVAYDMLAAYVTDEVVDDDPKPPEPAAETIPVLPSITDDLAAELFMDRAKLQEIADLLQSRQQLVLYGPPGTGKTYLAQKLSQHLVGSEDPSRVRLVQFHPSYAYEDFFEGYRPTQTEAGSPTFELKEGPLRLLAAEAALPENRGIPFILIIDEMNRANLAKVFGELYFLLEYRRETIRLQYQPNETFRLPRNLFIIGTMNTADRSIALVDAAIRRRFPFYELHPGEEPVKSVLERFMKGRLVQDDRVQLLATLNDAIGQSGRDLHIGPSYLMRPDIDRPGGLDLVWRFDILPLLEEHFYGHRDRDEIRKSYGLTGLRARMAKQQSHLAPSPSAEDEIEAMSDGHPDAEPA